MSRPDKTVEPSMEEILASIRKIISEEPIGTRPGGPSDAQASAGALGRYEPGAEPSFAGPTSAFAPRGPRTSDTVGIDEMLDFAQGNAPRRSSGPVGDQGRPLIKPVGAAEPRLSPASFGDATAAPARDGVTKGTKSIFPPLQHEVNGHAVIDGPGDAAAGKPLDDTARGVRPSVDADAALSQARAKIERHLGKPASIEGIDRALVPGVKSIRDADFRGSRQEAAGRPAAGGLMARVAAAGAQAEPSAKDHAGSPAQANAGGPGGLGDAAGAAQKAADSPAVPKPDAIKASMPHPAANAAGSETSQAAVVQVESKPVERAAAGSGNSPQPGERARALEDAVAEMLRPMLREWLDANLPRLVQEALREEMAKSPLPAKDSQAG